MPKRLPVSSDLVPLVAARLTKGWSQGDVAEMLGVSQAFVSNVESGRSVPTLSFLESYAKLVRLSMRIIYTPIEGGDEE